MDLEFLHTRLLAKLPLKTNGIYVYSPELIDIADVGIKEYQRLLSLCLIGKEQLEGEVDESIQDYDVLLSFLLNGLQENKDDGIKFFNKSLKFFTKSEFDIAEKDGDIVFLNDDFVLNRENYNDFRQLIKMANCIDVDIKPDEEMDEFDRIAMEIEEEMRKAEGGGGESIPFKDLVSSVANMPSNDLNIINIWNINIYTLYEQLKRGQMYESYILGLKQILAGAKQKDVNLKHYMSKI